MQIATAAVLAIALSMAVCGQTQPPAASTPSTNGPVVVQRVGFENQTGAIPQTTIYTPSHTGLYRITIYMEETMANAANTSGSFCASLGYTNDSGVARDPFETCLFVAPSLSDNDGWTFAIRAMANTPILFSTSLGGDPPPVLPFAYSTFVTIERL